MHASRRISNSFTIYLINYMDSKILIYLELAVRFEESKSKGIHFLLYPEKKKTKSGKLIRYTCNCENVWTRNVGVFVIVV